MKKFSKFALFLALSGSILSGNLDFNTLKSDFTQVVLSEGKTLTYTGNFIADTSHAFWHYEKPNVKNIYFSGSNAIIIEPALEQVIQTSLKQTPDLSAILRSAKQISDEIYSAEFDGIKYKIKLKNGLPSQVTYKDKLENDVTFTLKNAVKNEPIKDNKIFTPIIPANFDIVTN